MNTDSSPTTPAAPDVPGGAGSDQVPELVRAVEAVCSAPRLLVALDFDGTLAPFEVDPGDSRADPLAMEAVEHLVNLPDTEVALVSGRGLDSLAEVAHAPRGVALVGSHGLEMRLADGSTHHVTLDAGQERTLAELDEHLESLALTAPGAWVERKPSSVSLHTRAVTDPGVAADLEERAEAAGRDLEGVDVLPGKHVVELAVLRGDKGQALDRLRALLGVDAVFYAGDDTTDERAFRALEPPDVGVHVGDGPSAASQRVPDIPAMSRLLEHLARCRRESGSAGA